ncbi:MAG: DUF3106 domain-containing protein [Opitutales bacterium]
MKHIIILFLPLFCLVQTGSGSGFQLASATGNRGGEQANMKDTAAHPEQPQHKARMLDHLLSMEQEELAELRKTIERIEKMSPKEKKALKKRLARLREMDPEQIRAHRERFKAIPESARKEFKQKWHDMTPEERRKWHEKWHDMSAEEHRKHFKKHRPNALNHKGEKKQGPCRQRKHDNNKDMDPEEEEEEEEEDRE